MGVPYRVETNHPWPDNTLWGGFLLAITNFILAPSIILFIRWGRFDIAGVLTLLCVVSSAYHMCRAGFVCFTQFHVAQTYDHLCVYMALLWITSYCIVRNEWFPRDPATGRRDVPSAYVTRMRAGVFFLTAIPVLGLVLNNPESVWVNIFGFGIPATLVIISAVVTRTHIFHKPIYGWIGVAMFVTGAAFYSVAPYRWYDWAHSLWHVLSMLAVPFIAVSCDEELWKMR